MTKRNRRAIVVWVSAALLVLAGVVTITVGLLTPVSFGWFAYQPLANASFVPAGNFVVLPHTTVVGFVVLALGLVLVVFLIGWWAAKRHMSRPSE